MPAIDHLSEIIARFDAGESMRAIGERFGVSHERIRQLVVGNGRTGRRGGTRIPTYQRVERGPTLRQRNAARKAERMIRNYGCSESEALSANGGPLGARDCLAAKYRAQRHQANHRGIEWKFSFPEWVAAWADSGHLHERGRGGYVMARFGDEGPYAAGNVYFTTTGGNVSDYFAKFRADKGLRPSPAAQAYRAKRGLPPFDIQPKKPDHL